MDLNIILDELNKGAAEDIQRAEDEECKKFLKEATSAPLARALTSRGSVSFGSYEEDLKALYGKDEVERLREDMEDVPNKNGDSFAQHTAALGDAFAKGLVSRQTVLQKLMGNMSMNANEYYTKLQVENRKAGIKGTKMSAPVRPQAWTGHKPSFSREYELEQATEHCSDVLFGPYPGDKSEDTVEQLKHLLTKAQANRAQEGERPANKPCRFLLESVRDSDVSGVPVGVRQRCAHPVFEQKAMYGLLSVYAEMLNVTEKFCEALVKSNPEVLDALPTARRIALAASQSLLITPRENNKDLIISYLTDLDFLRSKVCALIDEMKKTHALTVADDRFFTNVPGTKIHDEPEGSGGSAGDGNDGA